MNLIKSALTQRTAFVVALTAGAISLCGCSKADENVAAAPSATTAAPTTPAPAAGPVGTPITAPERAPTAPPPPPTAEASAWTPAALDELLAPIALYPEPVLAQVLTASTNSQEVLDAGNWLIDNDSLKGDALTKAASEKGFSPAVQALVQFPTVVDMMCRELDWTKQLGDAFSADQSAVLASVQRLRAQAAAAGNLKSSPQMTVDTTQQQGKTVIEVKPADPQVIYVPQYNPETVYTTAPAATTTTTTTTDSNSSGLTKNEAVMGGLLAFGAGILVANLFDDNDDHYGYGYPNYGYGGVYYGGRPYYPGNTFVYAPRYNGYRPANGYRPPAGYRNNYNNVRNTNVNVNQNNNYYNRFDKNQNRMSNYQPKTPVAGDRQASGSGYKGADRPRNTGATAGTSDRAGQAGTSGAYKGGSGSSSAYKGAAQNRQGSSSARREAQTAQRPTGGADRGYPQASGNRSDAAVAKSNRGGDSFSGAGANQGGADRAASQRGRDSMQSAPRPSSQPRSGGGGGQRAGGGGGGGGRGGGGGGGGGRGGRG